MPGMLQSCGWHRRSWCRSSWCRASRVRGVPGRWDVFRALVGHSCEAVAEHVVGDAFGQVSGQQLADVGSGEVLFNLAGECPAVGFADFGAEPTGQWDQADVSAFAYVAHSG